MWCVYVCVCVSVHTLTCAREGSAVEEGVVLMGNLDLPNFFFPPFSFHWTDAPQDATLLSW